MSERRHPTGEELDELYHRAKRLIDKEGRPVKDDSRRVYKGYYNQYLGVQIELRDDNMLYIGDSIAPCMSVHYENGGIQNTFGGSAMPVIKKLRELMVLDDLADV
jgi:hypothetical protein